MRFPPTRAELGGWITISGCLIMNAALSGCQTTGGITPTQAGQLICVLASDGATVAAIVKPGVSVPAGLGAQVVCNAGTQVGAILN